MLGIMYPWLKAFHVVSMVSWMAGLLYLPRLFVNHAEKAPAGSELSEVFTGMERRLLKIIMNPAMMATWTFGLILLFMPGAVDHDSIWIWAKILLVVGLTWYHVWLGKCHKRFAAGENQTTGKTFRRMNELPAVIMVLVVVLVFVRPF